MTAPPTTTPQGERDPSTSRPAEADALFEEARRGERRRRLGGVAVLVAICAVGAVIYAVGFSGNSTTPTSTPGATPAGNTRPTLSDCVEAWNRASVGLGRGFAKAAAANSPPALMFAFADGACGLAFPAPVAAATGGPGVFVSVIGGDYALDSSPGEPAFGPSVDARLEALADKQTNVRMKIGGTIVPLAHPSTMPSVGLRAVDPTATCTHIISLTPSSTYSLGGYDVVKATVPCLWVNSLIWAWSADQYATTAGASPPSQATILGYRCVGTKLKPFEGITAYNLVTCRDGANLVQARPGKTRLG